MSKYDVVIIGSGLGGLECATMLSKEGLNVCVVEKNSVFGGCLQSFKRAGQSLDTGIHYIGSMDEGQILHQYFKYFQLLDRIKLRRLDNDAFDVICYGGDEYCFAQGYDNFAETLSRSFPAESDNIVRYTNKIKQICGLIGVEHLRQGSINQNGTKYFEESASQMIEQSVSDERLRNVLAGTVTLYGGVRNSSTLYHHAMINGSNIEGAYRIVDGSQSVADAFVDIIKENGGTVCNHCEVTRIVVENGSVSAVEINNAERIEADYFISDIHPRLTFGLVDKTSVIKKAFLTRVNSLHNSYGLFSVYLTMKKDTFPYMNRNYYIYDDKDVWYASAHEKDTSIKFALLSTQANSTNEQYADVVTILCPMFFSEVEAWSETSVHCRGEEYESFKRMKAEQLIDFVSRRYPHIRKSINQMYTTTPLTYRDYTSTVDGSAYGVMKDCNSPFTTLIPVRTKIKNLLLTGQNLNVHGALGVTLTATLTCAELLGSEFLAKKIGEV